MVEGVSLDAIPEPRRCRFGHLASEYDAEGIAPMASDNIQFL
jgi:hypothetical protein